MTRKEKTFPQLSPSITAMVFFHLTQPPDARNNYAAILCNDPILHGITDHGHPNMKKAARVTPVTCAAFRR